MRDLDNFMRLAANLQAGDIDFEGSSDDDDLNVEKLIEEKPLREANSVSSRVLTPERFAQGGHRPRHGCRADTHQHARSSSPDHRPPDDLGCIQRPVGRTQCRRLDSGRVSGRRSRARGQLDTYTVDTKGNEMTTVAIQTWQFWTLIGVMVAGVIFG